MKKLNNLMTLEEHTICVNESFDTHTAEKIFNFMEYVYKIFDKAQTDKIPSNALSLSVFSKKFKVQGKLYAFIRKNEFIKDSIYIKLKNPDNRVDEKRANELADKFMN